MKRLETLETPYNDVDVWETMDGGIDFDVIGATHATWHPERVMTGHAWDALTAGVLMHPGPPTSLLLLGLGGGTVLRQLRAFLPHLHLTAVEIDPGMIRLAREYMELDQLNVNVIEDDAFNFLAETTSTYDVVIDDLYRCGDRDVERPRTVDAGNLTLLKNRLNPGGVLVMNFVLGRGHQTQVQNTRTLYKQTFPSRCAIAPPKSHNQALVGCGQENSLRSKGELRGFAEHLKREDDQALWKELRVLPLR